MPRTSLVALVCCALVACAPAAPPPPPPTPLPTSAPPQATSTPTAVARVAPTTAPTPSPTPRLVSQAQGPVSEPVPALATPAPAPAAAPLPRETITPADQCNPNQVPGPFGQGAPGGFSSFRAPLPATAVYNPPGVKRVGLQVGHWRNDEVPPELGRLQGGATGGGKAEWEVNLEIARRAKAMLEAMGHEVDLLPATVPMRYQAHAFVAIHADGDTAGALTGYKIARPGFSSVPDTDDRLVDALYRAYGPVTGLRRDDEHISLRMLYYYAFNSRRYCHAVAPGVPQVIVETGFLTSASDRQLLIGNPTIPARGIAEGIDAFLGSQ
jgi:hypothetical protein